MSANKFLDKLNQPDLTPHTPRQEIERVTPPPVSSEYDPIQRLTEELTRQNRALEGINIRMDRLEKRPQAATLNDVQTLAEQARQGVRYTIDAKALTALLLPELVSRLPSTAGINAALEASTQQLTAAGVATAQRVERAGTVAASRIESASRSQADVWAGRVGFTSWKAAAVVFFGFVVLLVLASWQNEQQVAEKLKAQAETQAVREFTNWVKSQPGGKQLYDRYYRQ